MLDEIVIDPPDRTFASTATVEVGGRAVELRYLGRGHTDHDIVISVPGTDVLFAGDLLENGAVPWYGDGYPIEWATTAQQLAQLIDPERGVVVPGHGDQAGRAFAETPGRLDRGGARPGGAGARRRDHHRRCGRGPSLPGAPTGGRAAAAGASGRAAPRGADTSLNE